MPRTYNRQSRTRPGPPQDEQDDSDTPQQNVLRPTERQGIYRNSMGVLCDERGVALSFKQLREREFSDHLDVIGEEADTPAKFLKSVALDPRIPLGVRIDSAKAAAPYYDRKTPVALDGGVDQQGNVRPLIDLSKLQSLSDKELQVLKMLLAKADVKAE